MRFLKGYQRKQKRIAGEPVRHDQNARQKKLRRNAERRKFIHGRIPANLQRKAVPLLPDTLKQTAVFFPVNHFPVILKIIVYFGPKAAFQRLAVMRADDLHDPVRVSQLFLQDRCAAYCMPGFFPCSLINDVCLRTLKPCQGLDMFVQISVRLRHNTLERDGCFADVVKKGDIDRSRQKFAFRKTYGASEAFRQPLLNQLSHHSGCVQKMDGQRKPSPASLSVAFSSQTVEQHGDFSLYVSLPFQSGSPFCTAAVCSLPAASRALRIISI